MKKISIILIDWSVRESYHSIEYLNKQNIARDIYEIIWVEYYDYKSPVINEYAINGYVDKWIVLGQTGQYKKHLMYNEGIAAAGGEIIVICDSDAVFSSNFVGSVIKAFEKNNNIVLYLEEVRNISKCFYPFKMISPEEIMKIPNFINWDYTQKKPLGLLTDYNIIHFRNYGACFCARREDIIKAGGCDEHSHYASFLCGPYELGWRLVNGGLKEIWHEKEWILHLWHPWVNKDKEIFGLDDGYWLSLVALEAKNTKRIYPLVENEKIKKLRIGGKTGENFEKHATDKKNLDLKGLKENKSAQVSLPLKVKFGFWRAYFNAKRVLWKLKENFCFALTDLNYIMRKNLVRILDKTKVKAGKSGKILVVMEKFLSCEQYSSPINAKDELYENIKIILGQPHKVRIFYTGDSYRNKFEKSGLLIKEVLNFKPELIVFAPVSPEIDPTQEALRKITKELKIKLYIHIFNSAAQTKHKENMVEFADIIGLADGEALGGYKADNIKIFSVYGMVALKYFYDKKTEKDIDVSFVGSVRVNGKRNEHIEYLRKNGVKVYTRPYRLPLGEYSDILNRSKISINFCGEKGYESRLGGRIFEIISCKAMLLQENGAQAEKILNEGKDFVSFKNKEDLLEKIRHYLKRERERFSIAQSGHDKALKMYGARQTWINIFDKLGLKIK